MLKKMLDDLKNSINTTLRGLSLGVAALLTGFVALCFLCAAAFIFILDRYGPIEACLAGAGAFLLVAIVLVIWRLALRRRAKRRAETAKSAMQVALMDPMVIAAGIQIVRTIGIKRLVPLLAIAGVALGLLTRPANQNKSDKPDKQ
ncbi:MAG TPA: hypothetical protein VKS78_07650 [Roseiarcus sp.]|nr:hypothetical protein [Roseiarcus sp.]